MLSRRNLLRGSAAILVNTGALGHAHPTQQWSEDYDGTPLDLTEFEVAFETLFNRPSVTPNSGSGPWYAPVHTDIGVGAFAAPGDDHDIYRQTDEHLYVGARRDERGRWTSGSIQSVNANGYGFAQTFGYFEARLRFPESPGAWCAFWLKSRDEHRRRDVTRAEIDAVEWYGSNPIGHHRAVHLRPAYDKPRDGIDQHWWTSNYSKEKNLGNVFHDYGVNIDPTHITVYLDRKEVARFATLAPYAVPLYPIVSLMLHEKDLDLAAPSFEMAVERVSVYKKTAS